MTQVRYNTHVPSFQPEDAFGVKNGTFSSGRAFQAWWGWGMDQFLKGEIENQTIRSDLGENEPGVGLANDNSTLNFNAYPEGLGTYAGSGDTPVANAFTHLMASSLGAAPVLHDGSTVKAASTPSATSIVETDAGAHAANGVLVLQDERAGMTGRVVCRPYNTYATDTFTLLMGLPAAVVSAITAGSAIIYGCIVVNLAENGIYSLQGDILGAVQEQSFEFFGAVFNMSIGEVNNGEAPSCAFEGKVASFTRNVATSRTSVDSQRPVTLAGGEFLLAKYGNTTATALNNLRFNFVLGRTYTRQSEQNDNGIGGWVCTDQQTRLTLYVDHDATPPAGFSESDYFEMWENGGTSNRLHYFCTLGARVRGRVFGFYLPKMHMVQEPRHVEMEGIHLIQLMFAITQGGNSVRFFQA